VPITGNDVSAEKASSGTLAVVRKPEEMDTIFIRRSKVAKLPRYTNLKGAPSISYVPESFSSLSSGACKNGTVERGRTTDFLIVKQRRTNIPEY
jgi:hypothetical protein